MQAAMSVIPENIPRAVTCRLGFKKKPYLGIYYCIAHKTTSHSFISLACDTQKSDKD